MHNQPITGPWRKSSHSGGTGECVEIALGTGTVAARDSKNPEGPHLAVPLTSWKTFIQSIR